VASIAFLLLVAGFETTANMLALIEMRIADPALISRFPDCGSRVPAEEVRTREEMRVYGVHELPVER
jgi:cytochrome P450